MSNEQLTDAEIGQQAAHLMTWEVQGQMLYRQFIFKDFITAFEFMSKVAELAEQANHHPNWSNVYNKIDIALTTHEFNSISQRDFDLAKKIDQLYIKLSINDLYIKRLHHLLYCIALIIQQLDFIFIKIKLTKYGLISNGI